MEPLCETKFTTSFLVIGKLINLFYQFVTLDAKRWENAIECVKNTYKRFN